MPDNIWPLNASIETDRCISYCPNVNHNTFYKEHAEELERSVDTQMDSRRKINHIKFKIMFIS